MHHECPQTGYNDFAANYATGSYNNLATDTTTSIISIVYFVFNII